MQIDDQMGEVYEMLSKIRAQYARMVKREKQLLEQAGYLGEGDPDGTAAAGAAEGEAPEPGTPAYKRQLRDRARHLGVL